jgi:hypothetical protein
MGGVAACGQFVGEGLQVLVQPSGLELFGV